MELAVVDETDVATRELGAGGAHLVDPRVGGTAMGREREQRDARRLTEQRLAARRRGLGDVGEIVRRGIGHHAAVGEDHRASILEHHEEARRHHAETGPWADRAERRAHRVGGGRDRAHHRAVGPAGGNQQGGIVQRVERQACAGVALHAARPEARHQVIDQRRQARIARRHSLDDEQRLADALGAGPCRRLLHAGIETLGEDDGPAQNAGSPAQRSEAGLLGG